MRISLKILLSSSLLLFLANCGSTQKVSETETIQQAWNDGNIQQTYNLSTSAISKLESKGKEVPTQLLTLAGESALRLDKIGEARQFLENALHQDPESESIYPMMVQVYEKIDNLSYEITTLKNYKKRFPEGKYQEDLNLKLFYAFVKSKNWQLAKTTWINLDTNQQSKPENLEKYIVVLEQLKQNNELNKIVQKLLQVDAGNTLALTHSATQIYNQAEKRYSTEMAAYNARKTRKQYAILLNALEHSTQEFKKARDMFETVYKQNSDTEVASYLANIYARLNNDSKSKYYKQQAHK